MDGEMPSRGRGRHRGRYRIPPETRAVMVGTVGNDPDTDSDPDPDGDTPSLKTMADS
jgi:hypothetical protein